MLGPPCAELGAGHREPADELAQLRIVGVLGGVVAQDRDVFARYDGPQPASPGLGNSRGSALEAIAKVSLPEKPRRVGLRVPGSGRPRCNPPLFRDGVVVLDGRQQTTSTGGHDAHRTQPRPRRDPCRRLRRHPRLYQDKLDFTVDQEWPFGDIQLAYLSNGTAKIEILGGSTAEPHATIDSLDDSLGVEAYHHLCLNVADVDATLAELRSRGVEVLGDAIDLEAIGRRLGFLKDNNDNVIELASPLSTAVS